VEVRGDHAGVMDVVVNVCAGLMGGLTEAEIRRGKEGLVKHSSQAHMPPSVMTEGACDGKRPAAGKASPPSSPQCHDGGQCCRGRSRQSGQMEDGKRPDRLLSGGVCIGRRSEPGSYVGGK